VAAPAKNRRREPGTGCFGWLSCIKTPGVAGENQI
jgi:hypothetical protein